MSTQTFAGSKHEDFLALAVKLALDNVQNDQGRPFGAVVVKDRAIIATGVNTILASGDPTAHAELEAIRAAARAQRSTRLDGHIVYASGHPCPMCLGAMYLTGIRQVYYAYSNEDGEPYGLSTRAIYAELAKPLAAQSIQLQHLPLPGAGRELYEAWRQADQSNFPPR
jgi:guanine deaminase